MFASALFPSAPPLVQCSSSPLRSHTGPVLSMLIVNSDAPGFVPSLFTGSCSLPEGQIGLLLKPCSKPQPGWQRRPYIVQFCAPAEMWMKKCLDYTEITMQQVNLFFVRSFGMRLHRSQPVNQYVSPQTRYPRGMPTLLSANRTSHRRGTFLFHPHGDTSGESVPHAR